MALSGVSVHVGQDERDYVSDALRACFGLSVEAWGQAIVIENDKRCVRRTYYVRAWLSKARF